MLESLYMVAWNDLSTERPIGMVEGYLPRSKIKQYGIEDLGLEGDQLEFFISVISKTDTGYLTASSAIRSDNKVRDVVSKNDVSGIKALLSRLAAPPGGGDRFTKRKPGLIKYARKRPDPKPGRPSQDGRGRTGKG